MPGGPRRTRARCSRALRRELHLDRARPGRDGWHRRVCGGADRRGAPTSHAVHIRRGEPCQPPRGRARARARGRAPEHGPIRRPPSILLRGVWLAAFAALLLGSSVFLVEGTAGTGGRPSAWAQVQPPPGGVMPQGLSLDGMAYMRGWYPGDYAAITWLNTHLAGDPTIVEASNGPYQWYGRVAIYTGLPERARGGAVMSRSSAIPMRSTPARAMSSFYATTDPAVAHDILGRYGVSYVYWDLERSCPLSDSNNECSAPLRLARVAKYRDTGQQGLLRPIYQDLGVDDLIRWWATCGICSGGGSPPKCWGCSPCRLRPSSAQAARPGLGAGATARAARRWLADLAAALAHPGLPVQSCLDRRHGRPLRGGQRGPAAAVTGPCRTPRPPRARAGLPGRGRGRVCRGPRADGSGNARSRPAWWTPRSSWTWRSSRPSGARHTCRRPTRGSRASRSTTITSATS